LTVKIATYNIHYGVGPDGKYDLQRIVDAVADADVIAFQEVSRGFIGNQGRDMVAEIEALLPDRFADTHMPADIDVGSVVENGKAVQRRFQFGNMIVSRWPLLSVRGHLLPRSMRTETLNLQRGALEALIDTPAGTIRFYSVHLDHIHAGERDAQITALKSIASSSAGTGLSVTGMSEYGFDELPAAEDFLLLGDYNFEPDLMEYRAMLSRNGDLVDASAADTGWSWIDSADRLNVQRLDYGFANTRLAARISGAQIDQGAEGSDHVPVWFHISA
jgi:endonuclease/exonuclease/phosphatase family metal-dependent hydrolase